MTVGESIKRFREAEGLSQGKLGKALDIKQANLSRWEAGINIPSVLDCWKLANFYKVSIDELVGRDGELELQE